jgi:hypothetical protein
MTFVVTAGQRHEAAMFEQLMESPAVKRVGGDDRSCDPAG